MAAEHGRGALEHFDGFHRREVTERNVVDQGTLVTDAVHGNDCVCSSPDAVAFECAELVGCLYDARQIFHGVFKLQDMVAFQSLCFYAADRDRKVLDGNVEVEQFYLVVLQGTIIIIIDRCAVKRKHGVDHASLALRLLSRCCDGAQGTDCKQNVFFHT